MQITIILKFTHCHLPFFQDNFTVTTKADMARTSTRSVNVSMVNLVAFGVGDRGFTLKGSWYVIFDYINYIIICIYCPMLSG